MSNVTATGRELYAPVRVPSESDFGIEQYLPAKDLAEVGGALVRSPILGLGSLLTAEVDVRYLWRKKAKKSKGKVTRATCTKIGPRERHFARNADFVIEVAADDARERKMTQIELEALIYHELLHVGVEYDDETGDVTLGILGHDVEMFADEVGHYGLWRDDLEHAAIAFEQAGMFGDSGKLDTAYPAEFVPVTITGTGSNTSAAFPEFIEVVDASTGEIVSSNETSNSAIFGEPFLIDGASGDEFDTGDLPPDEDEGNLTTGMFDMGMPAETPSKTAARALNVGGENFHANIGAEPMDPSDPDWVWMAERQREELMLWESDPARALSDKTPDELVAGIKKLDRKIKNDTMNDSQRRSARMQRLAHVRKLERMDPVPPVYQASVVSAAFGFEVVWNDEHGVYVGDNSDAYAAGIIEDEYRAIIAKRGPAARDA